MLKRFSYLNTLKKYSLKELAKEFILYCTGYYAKLSTIRKAVFWIHILLITLYFLAGISYGTKEILMHVLNSESSLKSKFSNINFWDVIEGDYAKFVETDISSQKSLVYFALYAIATKTLFACFAICLILFWVKLMCAICISNQTWNVKKATRDKMLLDAALNPIFPWYCYTTINNRNIIMAQHEKKISLGKIMNEFLQLHSFPKITGDRLVKVDSLSFMYHGDNDWDKYLHLFLKKFFPKLYERHLFKTNTVSKEEEARKSLHNLQALKNINLSISNSKFTTILGCNGSSKTTLLKAMINLFDKYSGKITWITRDLKDISHKSFYKNISYIAQNTLIHSKITVYDFVACGLFPSFSFFQFNYSSEHPLILKNLKKMGILQYRDKTLNTLSGGEKQKAIIARALTQETPVIILDEPTTYLDINNQYLILNLLKKLQLEENKTIITILHDIKQAEQFSDEVIILDEGTVYAYGKTENVITKENIRKIFGVSNY